MMHLMKIDDEDDSMERVNLDDYNSEDYKEYLYDNYIQANQATTEAKANRLRILSSSPSSYGHCQAGRQRQ